MSYLYEHAMSNIDYGKAAEQAEELRDVVGPGTELRSLCEWAQALHVFYEERCGRELEADEGADEESLERRIEDRARSVSEVVRVEFQGDPRGMPVKLHLRGRRSNNLGGGWGIG